MAFLKKPLFLLCIFSLLLSFSSCVVTENISFNNSSDLSGFSSSDIEVSDFFKDVIEDLSSWKESGNNDPVLDVAFSSVLENVRNSKYSNSVNFLKISENGYYIFFSFTDFEKLVESLCSLNEDQDLVTVSKNFKALTHLEFKLNLENWETLTTMVPFLAERNFAVWGPVYNNPPYAYVTEEDYKDLVGFILGEDGPQAIDKSKITIVIELPKKVVSTNGEKLTDKKISFSFPLIDFLLLHDEICFFCDF